MNDLKGEHIIEEAGNNRDRTRIRIRGRSSKLRTLLNEIDAAAAAGYYFPYLQAFVYLTS